MSYNNTDFSYRTTTLPFNCSDLLNNERYTTNVTLILEADKFWEIKLSASDTFSKTWLNIKS